MPARDSMLDYALGYIALGWYVLPLHSIIDGQCTCGSSACKSPGKHPATLNGVKDATNNPNVAKTWFKGRHNLGVACGKSGFIVFDVDPRNDGDDTFSEVKKTHGGFPDTVVALTGGGGEHYLFTVPEDKKVSFSGRGIDIQQGDKYIVVEPSNHASGNAYYWEGSCDPFEGQQIAPAPEWMLREKDNVVPIEEFEGYLSDSKVIDLRSALSYLDSGDRDMWVNVGMALKSTSNNRAFGLWNEWSQLSEKYDPSDMRGRWHGFKHAGHISVESIFYWAKGKGWVNTSKGSITTVAQNNAPIARQPEQIRAAEHSAIPGVLGEVVDWINATSRKPQPLFAVQAALAFASTLLGRRYVTTNGNWPSLYYLNIGKSASGKEHAKWAIEKLLIAGDVDDLIGPSRYSSESGILSALISKPNHVCVMDEFGKVLESANSASNYMARDVVKALMESWGRCDGVMRPVGYSTMNMSTTQIDEMQKRLVVKPALTLLGMTTPESFYESISSRGVRDGFLNRFLIAHTNIGRQPGRMLDSPPAVPVAAVSWMHRMLNVSAGNLADLPTPHDAEPNPHVIDFAPDARRLFEAFEIRCIERMNELEDDGLAEMFGRSNETAMRLALLVALSCSSMQIQIEHAQWAINYVWQLQQANVQHMREHLADSPFAKLKNDIYRAVLAAGAEGMTHRDLTRSVYGYRSSAPRQQEEVRQALVLDQLVQEQHIERGARKKVTKVLVAIETEDHG